MLGDSIFLKKKTEESLSRASTKSERSEKDANALLGVGATDYLGRFLASIGVLKSIQPTFQSSVDVPFGGVLLALPALLSCGLLSDVDKYFELPSGYYGLQSIFLLLGFMALCRLKTAEDLRYTAPGEWGKLLGLDRIPEVRTLREKIKRLSQDNAPEKWGAYLSQQWFDAVQDSDGVFYVDGHVRVYHGAQTKLPRHYVTREKLCLRATVDYWVNALGGEPFFFVNKVVDPGLINVLENDILPQIESSFPTMPEERLAHRFTIIFDREGYSPDLMKRLKEKKIACYTYHKYSKDSWPIEEFNTYIIQRFAGNDVKVQLAERGTYLSKKIWVREVRRRSDNGHQISIISTDYQANLDTIALKMSERWCQENFFKYMREHYNLDRLIDYSLESVPDTVQMVNPVYRQWDSEVRKLRSKHSRQLSEFGSIHLDEELDTKKMEEYQATKATLLAEIQQIEVELNQAKENRKAVAHYVTVNQLPEEERFQRLATPRKHFLDTIKMIAYRAETAMANILRTEMSHPDEKKCLLRSIYQTEADIYPDSNDNTLTICVHHCANPMSNKILQKLCEEMNETETVFPGTNLRLIYKLGSKKNLPDQVV